ncbi:hypothetical protein X734_23475 [Mesorhizobium sp. L2C084A000]|nr:hypothetical protein X734_23475 [Mesorhizobium sp. L2C084A000]
MQPERQFGDEGLANLESGTDKSAKVPDWSRNPATGAGGGFADQRGGFVKGGASLEDDRTAGGEGRRGFTADDRRRQWKLRRSNTAISCKLPSRTPFAKRRSRPTD